MKLLTYNIHHWEGTDGRVDVARVIDVIRESGAEIVALNEVFHPAYTEPDTQPLLETMARSLDMAFVFGETLSFYPEAGFPAPYGNALMTCHRILSTEVHLMVDLPGRERRGFLRAVLDTAPAPPLTVYATHLDHRHEDARLAQAKSMLRLIARFGDHPHVILGDFNALAPSDYNEHPGGLPALEKYGRQVIVGGQVVSYLLEAGYVDAYAAAGRGPGETWPTRQLQARIDYAFLWPTLAPRLRHCRRWESPLARVASDHLPLLLELTPGQPQHTDLS
jgi:endonuclease/exonuclease/phosphatase family metal-dependent hydrolase